MLWLDIKICKDVKRQRLALPHIIDQARAAVLAKTSPTNDGAGLVAGSNDMFVGEAATARVSAPPKQVNLGTIDEYSWPSMSLVVRRGQACLTFHGHRNVRLEIYKLQCSVGKRASCASPVQFKQTSYFPPL